MQTNIIAPFVLRAYAWEVLKANTNMRESQYEGKIPIVEISDDPNIKKYDKPYVVYAYSESHTESAGQCAVGNMAFVVNTSNMSELAQIVNVLTRAFERADDAARDVNEYSSTIPAFIGMRFGTIEIAFVDVDVPENTEGGPMQGVVNVRYEFYATYNALTTSLAHWDADNQRYVKNQG